MFFIKNMDSLWKNHGKIMDIYNTCYRENVEYSMTSVILFQAYKRLEKGFLIFRTVRFLSGKNIIAYEMFKTIILCC